MKLNKQNTKELLQKYNAARKVNHPLLLAENVFTFKELLTQLKWELFDKPRFIYFISMNINWGKLLRYAFNDAVKADKLEIKKHLTLHQYIHHEKEQDKQSFVRDCLLFKGDGYDFFLGILTYATLITILWGIIFVFIPGMKLFY